MAYTMSSHTPVVCCGTESVHQNRQSSQQSTQDRTVEVNRPSAEGIAVIFNHCNAVSRLQDVE